MKSKPLFIILSAMLSLSCFGKAFAQGSPVWTQHNDNYRTGANLNETLLTTSNVNTTKFGKIFSFPVDDQIYAQPLYVPNVTITAGAYAGTSHNVLFVATTNNSVYAFDADNPAGIILWNVNLTPAGEVTANSSELACWVYPGFFHTAIQQEGYFSKNIGGNGNMGVIGTPVIDVAQGVIYLVARTKGGTSPIYIWHQRLHALNIHSGVAISPRSPMEVPSNPPNGGNFDGKIQNQRAALGLSNGKVYVMWGGQCDTGIYHGWVMAFDATPTNPNYLACVSSFNVTPEVNTEDQAGGIWQAGQGPAIDDYGNLYFETGNGDMNNDIGASTYPRDLGTSFVKLNPSLSILDWFSPYNQSELSKHDYDLGSSGPMLIPGTNFLLGGGKESILHLLDRGNLGIYNGNGNPPTNWNLQDIWVNSQWAPTLANSYVERYPDPESTVGLTHHIHGGPVYWDRSNGPLIYVWAENDTLKSYAFNPTSYPHISYTAVSGGVAGPVSIGNPTAVSSMGAATGMPGGALALSANGSMAGSGILWASLPEGDASLNTQPGILRAFDAANVGTELWNSDLNTNDHVGNYSKFNVPSIANGRVYLATFSNRVNVYGRIPANCCNTDTTWTAPTGSGVRGVAVDSAKNYVYATDTNALKVYNTTGGLVTTINTGLTGIFAVAVGPNSIVYAASRTTGIIKKIDPNSSWVQSTFPCPTYAGVIRTLFVDDNENVYVAYDGGPTATTIRIFNPAGELMTSLTGVNNPTGIVKSGQALYVTDNGHVPGRIMKYPQGTTLFGAQVVPVAFQYGTPIEVVPFMQSPSGSNVSPSGLAVDAAGNFYVAAGAGYQVFDSTWHPWAPICWPTSGILDNGFGVAVDRTGGVFVAAQGPQKIVKMQSCMNLTPTPTPTPGCCQLAGAPWVTPPVLTGAEQGLSIDPLRNWLCVLSLGSLYWFQNSDGALVSAVSGPLLNGAYVVSGAATNSDVYVGCRTGKICKVNLLSRVMTQLTVNAGIARGIFLDQQGWIYETADDTAGTNLIYVVDPTGTSVYTLSPGIIGGSSMTIPSGILKVTTNPASGNGTLYIADPVNHRIVSVGLASFHALSGPKGIVTNTPNNPIQMATLGNFLTGNFYVGSFDGGFWFFKNQYPTNPYWSVLSPKSCTGSNIASLGNCLAMAVDKYGAVYFRNQGSAIFKVDPCKDASGGTISPSLMAPEREGSPTPGSLDAPLLTVKPNVSRNGEPVNFTVNLKSPGRISLSLFTVTGDLVYEESFNGEKGLNQYIWKVENKYHQKVASGLYIYRVQADGDGGSRTQTGKVVVMH